VLINRVNALHGAIDGQEDHEGHHHEVGWKMSNTCLARSPAILSRKNSTATCSDSLIRIDAVMNATHNERVAGRLLGPGE